MSIDAVITKVIRNADGTATILLGPRRPGGDPPGQARMIVMNPPLSFEACVGTEVWGGDDCLMVGETRWAEREGYARLRLLGQRKG